jgi:hypothetical protein
MAYGTNKKTRATIQRSEISVDKRTGKKTIKKYPAKEMKFKSITEKEFNSNGKPKKSSKKNIMGTMRMNLVDTKTGKVTKGPLKILKGKTISEKQFNK